MKIITWNKIENIGNAGLRCGHWVIWYQKRKTKNKNYLLGWHAGKFFAYFYELERLNLAVIEQIANPKDMTSFLKTHYKGWIWLLPNVFVGKMAILVRPKVFDRLVESEYMREGGKNPNVLRKQIKKECLLIK